MDVSLENSTIIIAFLLPGAIAMWGMSFFSDTVRSWLRPSSTSSSVGGAILFLVASLTAGLLTDALRTHTVDIIHFHTGVQQAEWSFEDLDKAKLEQFQGIMDNHFRYHQFYGNAFLCILFVYASWHIKQRAWPWPPSLRALAVTFLLIVTWLGSRTDLEAACQAVDELMQ